MEIDNITISLDCFIKNSFNIYGFDLFKYDLNELGFWDCIYNHLFDDYLKKIFKN